MDGDGESAGSNKSELSHRGFAAGIVQFLRTSIQFLVYMFSLFAGSVFSGSNVRTPFLPASHLTKPSCKTSSFVATRCKDDLSVRSERMLSDGRSEEGLIMVGHDVLECHLRTSERDAVAILNTGQFMQGRGYLKDVPHLQQVLSNKGSHRSVPLGGLLIGCELNAKSPEWIDPLPNRAPRSNKVDHLRVHFHGKLLDVADEEEWEMPTLPQDPEDNLIRRSIRVSSDYVEKWASAAALETHMYEMRQEQLGLEELIQMRKFFGEQPHARSAVPFEPEKSPSVGGSSQWSTSSTISVRSSAEPLAKSNPKPKQKILKADDGARTDCDSITACNGSSACSSEVDREIKRQGARRRRSKTSKRQTPHPTS